MILMYMWLLSLHHTQDNMCSVISIHALLLRYEAGRRALCTEPTCRNAVLCNVVDLREVRMRSWMSHPHILVLTIGPMYHEYIHITIQKIHHNVSDKGGNHVIKELQKIIITVCIFFQLTMLWNSAEFLCG